MIRVEPSFLAIAIGLLAIAAGERSVAAEPPTTGAASTGVVLEGPLVGMQITVDDQPVSADAVGFVALVPAVDHRLVVRVPLYVPFVLRLKLAAGEVQTVRPRLYRETAPAARPGSASLPTSVSQAPGFGQRHWPSLTALGLGVAGLATGVVFHLLARRDWARLDGAARDDDGAVTGLSERDAWALADRARERELGGWIGFGLGGGFLVASTVLLALEPFGESSDLGVMPAPGGVVLTGAW